MSKQPHITRTKQSRDDLATPHYVFKILNDEFQFSLDPCASAAPHSAKCKRYFTVMDDGLNQDWNEFKVFVNPPYKDKGSWIRKAYTAVRKNRCELAVLLIPDNTDTKVWHDIIFPHADEIRFAKGRIQFIDPETGKYPINPKTGKIQNSNGRGSAIVIFRAKNKYPYLKVSSFEHQDSKPEGEGK